MKITPSWTVFAVSGVVSAAATIPELWFFDRCVQEHALSFYQEHLREPLFTGLLTVAAFLFSLKTFIIVTMKENVYATKEYGDKIARLQTLDPTLRRYGPLEEFSLLLFLAVLITLTAAVVQFTVGLINVPLAASISICSAIWSLGMIAASLIYMQKNLIKWFRILDGSSK